MADGERPKEKIIIWRLIFRRMVTFLLEIFFYTYWTKSLNRFFKNHLLWQLANAYRVFSAGYLTEKKAVRGKGTVSFYSLAIFSLGHFSPRPFFARLFFSSVIFSQLFFSWSLFSVLSNSHNTKYLNDFAIIFYIFLFLSAYFHFVLIEFYAIFDCDILI